MSDTKLLVTGAAGKLGRETLDRLIAAGVSPDRIIATTRDVGKLAAYAQKGIDVRMADFSRPETLGPAFAGADRVAIISTDALGPGADRVA